MFKQFLSVMLLFAAVLSASAQDTRCYETRIYYTHPGRLEALLARFRNHTTKIFEKHGMTNVGYWIPLHEDNKLIYVLSYPDRAARDASWKAFGTDPEWKKVQSESELDGKIVAKVESIFMKATDFSPKIKSSKSKKERVFELRTYTTNTGKLPDLLSRFRDHTLKLFKKHGMTNVGYWVPQDAPASQNTLIYILAHDSREAAKKSWDEFRNDPEWKEVQKASEANGKIVSKVESVYMDATDYSPMK